FGPDYCIRESLEPNGDAGLKTLIRHLTHWDLVCFSGIFRLTKHRLFTRLMLLVTHSADGYLYPLAAVAVGLSSPSRLPSFFLAAAISFGIELPTYKLIKNAVKRNRPFVTVNGIAHRVVPPDHFSFPSGHTAAAFV